MIRVESPDTLPIFFRMRSTAAQASSLPGFAASRRASRAISFTDLPAALAFFLSCAAVASSTLRTRISTMLGSDDINMISRPLVKFNALPPAAAAVHIDRVRGHERAGVRAHEQHQFADLLRLAETLHRHVFEEPLHQLGRGLRRVLKRRLDRSRRDRQGADALGGE